MVCNILRKLATKRKITILATIHQVLTPLPSLFGFLYFKTLFFSRDHTAAIFKLIFFLILFYLFFREIKQIAKKNFLKVTKLFDKLLFLAQGDTLFFGPTFPHCLEYFDKAGFPIPTYESYFF